MATTFLKSNSIIAQNPAMNIVAREIVDNIFIVLSVIRLLKRIRT